MDPLTILTGLAVIAAIALAFWVAPEVRALVDDWRANRAWRQVCGALADDAICGEVVNPPNEWTDRQSLPSGGRVGDNADPSDTHTRQHGGKRNNR